MKLPGRSTILAIALFLAAGALTSVAAVPTYRTKAKTFLETIGGNTSQAVTATAEGGSGGSGGIAGTKPGQACAAGRNGGATDTGVTAGSIKLGATVVRSGIGSAFLGGAPTAMQAMATRVNREGGVCGRLLDLKMIDDGWDATKGVTYLRSLIDQGVFALAVSPSSEGVNALVTAGDLSKKGVPLIGADGLVKSEYKDPYVWPVAASTVSTMHIIVQEMVKRGAKTFGIVFANDYKFGVEGADAFYSAVTKAGYTVPGYDPSHSTCKKNFCGIISGQASYSSEVQEFNSSCSTPNAQSGYNPQIPPAGGSFPNCDLVALLLEPKTALIWLTKNGGAAPHGNGRTSGPQPLFSSDFAKQCGSPCATMEVWTSYNPPLPPYVNTPAVAQYSQTVKTLDPSIDVSNSFTEGAYVGMNVLVEALKRVGPNLTRTALKQALDSGTYDFGLGPPMQWRPGSHLGSGAMQSYSMQFQANSFIAFTLQSQYVTDSLLGKDL